MAKEFSSWDTTTGLPDAFTGPITDAYFGFNDDYQNGEVCVLTLVVQSDDDEIGDGGVIETLYPCGKGFEPVNKGAGVRHESGKNKGFNKSSGMGLLIDAALEVMGEDLPSKGDAVDAATWKGLAFDWERKEFSGTFGGEKSTWNRILPVAVAAGSATSKAASGSTKTSTPASGDDGDVKLPAKIKAALKKIAVAHDDHDAFMEAAFEAVGDIDGWDDAYEGYITDDGDEGLWASSQA